MAERAAYCTWTSPNSRFVVSVPNDMTAQEAEYMKDWLRIFVIPSLDFFAERIAKEEVNG